MNPRHPDRLYCLYILYRNTYTLMCIISASHYPTVTVHQICTTTASATYTPNKQINPRFDLVCKVTGSKYKNPIFNHIRGTNRNRCTQTLVILRAQTDLVVNPDSQPRTRSVWPTLRVKIIRRKNPAWMGTFKPAAAHIPRWDACFLSTQHSGVSWRIIDLLVNGRLNRIWMYIRHATYSCWVRVYLSRGYMWNKTLK